MPCPLLPTKIVWGLDFYLNRPKNAGFYLYLEDEKIFGDSGSVFVHYIVRLL